MTVNEKLDLCLRYIAGSPEEQMAISHKVAGILNNGGVLPHAVTDDDLRDMAANRLRVFGMPEHLAGFWPLVSAIVKAIKDPTAVRGITKIMYPELGKEFGVDASRIQRTIRNAIDIAWMRADYNTTYRIFGSSVSPSKCKPTNSEFIARFAGLIREEADYAR